MKPIVFSTFFSILFICLLAASAYFILMSCGVRIPFVSKPISFCLGQPDRLSAERLAALTTQQHELENTIYRMEAELAGRQCDAIPPEDHATLVAPPPKAVPTNELDPAAFNRRDVAAFEGCWQLVTQFDITDQKSGSILTFDEWRVCLDENGAGTEILTASDGTTCEGILNGAYSASGNFDIDKPGNLSCSNGMSIFKTQASCNFDSAGRASCALIQPSTGGRDQVALRRAAEGP